MVGVWLGGWVSRLVDGLLFVHCLRRHLQFIQLRITCSWIIILIDLCIDSFLFTRRLHGIQTVCLILSREPYYKGLGNM